MLTRLRRFAAAASFGLTCVLLYTRKYIIVQSEHEDHIKSWVHDLNCVRGKYRTCFCTHVIVSKRAPYWKNACKKHTSLDDADDDQGCSHTEGLIGAATNIDKQIRHRAKLMCMHMYTYVVAHPVATTLAPTSLGASRCRVSGTCSSFMNGTPSARHTVIVSSIMSKQGTAARAEYE